MLGGLYDRGRTTRDKIVNLKRNRMRLEGERGELTSQIAIAKGRIDETELEVLQLTTDQREKTFAEITEIEPEIANLKERRARRRLPAAAHEHPRPVAGTVFELAVHTVGGVVQPGRDDHAASCREADKLVVEAQARADRRRPGRRRPGGDDHPLRVRLQDHAAAQGRGDVRRRRGERATRRTGITYYDVRVALQDGELDRLPDDLVLMPGMPAEVYISTGGQTVVDYLVRPLSDQIRRAWRET